MSEPIMNDEDILLVPLCSLCGKYFGHMKGKPMSYVVFQEYELGVGGKTKKTGKVGRYLLCNHCGSELEKDLSEAFGPDEGPST